MGRKTATQPSTTLGELLEVEAANLVVLHDAWSGYSPSSPIVAAEVLVTDSEPRVEIAIHAHARERTSGGVAVLFSHSHDDLGVPWGVFVGDAVHTVTGDAIGRALRALDRPLKRAQLR